MTQVQLVSGFLLLPRELLLYLLHMKTGRVWVCVQGNSAHPVFCPMLMRIDKKQ